MTEAFKDLLSKVEATGSACLTESEKVAISEIFRRGALGDRYMLDLAQRIQRAHLNHCLTLEATTDG
jgi:hypothetical protein